MGRSASARPAIFHPYLRTGFPWAGGRLVAAPSTVLLRRFSAPVVPRSHQRGATARAFSRETQVDPARDRWPDNRVRPGRRRPTYPLTTPRGALGTGFHRRPGYGPSGPPCEDGHQNAAPRPTHARRLMSAPLHRAERHAGYAGFRERDFRRETVPLRGARQDIRTQTSSSGLRQRSMP